MNGCCPTLEKNLTTKDYRATYVSNVPLMHFIISYFVIIVHWVTWISANHTKSSKQSLSFPNQSKHSIIKTHDWCSGTKNKVSEFIPRDSENSLEILYKMCFVSK